LRAASVSGRGWRRVRWGARRVPPFRDRLLPRWRPGAPACRPLRPRVSSFSARCWRGGLRSVGRTGAADRVALSDRGQHEAARRTILAPPRAAATRGRARRAAARRRARQTVGAPFRSLRRDAPRRRGRARRQSRREWRGPWCVGRRRLACCAAGHPVPLRRYAGRYPRARRRRRRPQRSSGQTGRYWRASPRRGMGVPLRLRHQQAVARRLFQVWQGARRRRGAGDAERQRGQT
jgi:hypothetical protein